MILTIALGIVLGGVLLAALPAIIVGLFYLFIAFPIMILDGLLSALLGKAYTKEESK